MDRRPTDLSEELAELRARLASLEAERTASRGRVRWAGAAVVIAALIGTAASAANGACPNGFPFCFNSNTPALASEVNTNFLQIKEWLESKVGTVAAPVRITTGATVSTVTPPTQASARSSSARAPRDTPSPSSTSATTTSRKASASAGAPWSPRAPTRARICFSYPRAPARSSSRARATSTWARRPSPARPAPATARGAMHPLSWTGTCNGAGIGVYSVLPATLNGQRGFDVQCINSAFNGFAPLRGMVVTCSRLITQ